MTNSDLSSAKRVLVYRLGSLGDTVVALPSLHLIARSFPNAERVMLTNFPVHAKAPASAAVIGDSGLIHRYMRYTAKTRNPLEIASLWWQLRRFQPEVLVYLMPVRPPAAVRRDMLFFKLAGVKTMIGLPGPGDMLHVLDPRTNTFQSEASRLARSLHALGDADLDNAANWDLRFTTAERAKTHLALGALPNRPFIVCAPGTKMPAKDWGTDNWAALLQRLGQQFPKHSLVLVGAGEEKNTCELVARGWTGSYLNLCGSLSPRETAAVIQQAIIFLGPDSGPMHLAAAVGTPCAIAFSARGKPGVWFPHGTQHRVVYHQVDCFGCLLETCVVEGKKCLTSISVDEMFEAAMAASKQPSPQMSSV